MGGRQPASPRKWRGVWLDSVSLCETKYLMLVLVQFGICFGPLGLVSKPYMKSTLTYVAGKGEGHDSVQESF